MTRALGRRAISIALILGATGMVHAGEEKTATYFCGFINGDSTLTTGDGFDLLNYLGGTGTVYDTRGADLNGDCSLTPADGFQLLNYFGGTGEGFDCDHCWPGCMNC